MTLLRDENGQLSTARTSFWLWLVVFILVIGVDVLTPIEVASHVFSAMVAVVIALAAWAGGSKMAQHLGPQIGKAARAISSVRPSGDGLRDLQNQIAEIRAGKEDDERGEFKDREPVEWP